jgi:hypothetical protein
MARTPQPQVALSFLSQEAKAKSASVAQTRTALCDPSPLSQKPGTPRQSVQIKSMTYAANLLTM